MHRVRCIFWKHSSWHEGQANCLNFLPICNPELLLSTVEIIFSASCILQKRPFIAGIKLQGVCSSISVLFLSPTVVMFDSLTAFCHLCTLTAVWKGTCCCVGWHILFGSLHEFSADMCVLVTGVITALLAPSDTLPPPSPSLSSSRDGLST